MNVCLTGLAVLPSPPGCLAVPPRLPLRAGVRTEAEAVRQGRLQGVGEEELAVMKERSKSDGKGGLQEVWGDALEKKAGGLFY